MARLLDHFAPCVSAGLRLAEKLDQSNAHLESASSVREKLRDDVLAAKSAAEGEVRPQPEVDLAAFAVVTWIDEVMLRYPEWGRAVANLQGELLHTQIARELFFSNLEGLTPDQDEVREIYYLILSLGFQGFYGQLDTGKEELERLKDLHERQLKTPPLAPGGLVDEKLTPQPYAATPPPPPRKPRVSKKTPLPWGKIALAAAAALLLLIVGGFFGLRGLTDRRVQAAVAQLECAAVQTDVGINRVARLNGRVESFVDQQKLIESVADMTFVRHVDAQLDVVTWPFCEVLVDVEPLKKLTDADGFANAIGLAGGVDRLQDQEYVVIEATAPGFDGFVYLFDIRGDGGVVHFLPNTILTDNRRFGGDRITVGDKASGVRLRVEAPFGLEMLLLVATSEPVLGDELRNSSNFEDFIGTLRSGLAEIQRVDGQIAVDYFFLETRP